MTYELNLRPKIKLKRFSLVKKLKSYNKGPIKIKLYIQNVCDIDSKNIPKNEDDQFYRSNRTVDFCRRITFKDIYMCS